MARGAEAKAEVMRLIIENFDAAFVYGKEIRIPMIDNGEEVQIKVALTCAKDNVAPGDDTAVPTPKVKAVVPKQGDFSFETEEKTVVEPTENELDNIANLLGALGL